MHRDVCRGLLALLLVAGAAHGEATEKFAYGYPLVGATTAPAYVVALPREAYAWSRPAAGLGDVIVVDADGREVPSAPYLPAATVSRPVVLSLPLLAVPASAQGAAGPRIERSANGDIVIQPAASAPSGTVTEWLIDAREPIRLSDITLPPTVVREDADVQLDNVSVDVSKDLQTWRSLVRQATIMSVGHGDRGSDVSTISVNGPVGRYYRVRIVSGGVTWAGDGQPVARLGGRIEAPLAADVAPRQWLRVAPAKTTPSGQGVDYDYDVPDALPIDALRLMRGSDAVARLDASSLDSGRATEPLGTLVVTAAQGDGMATLHIGRARRTALRLHSDTPLREAPPLLLGWVADRFVYLPGGKPPYRLLVGSALARRPSWPIDEALDGLRKQQPEGWRPAPATVGPVATMEGDDALVMPDAPFDTTRLVLWIVLALGAAVVGGIAVSLLRGTPAKPVDHDPDEEDNDGDAPP